jgi:hypothetical protein
MSQFQIKLRGFVKIVLLISYDVLHRWTDKRKPRIRLQRKIKHDIYRLFRQSVKVIISDRLVDHKEFLIQKSKGHI